MSNKLAPHQYTKVAIVGCGRVGMTAAYSLAHSGSVDELVLLGRDRTPLMGEKLDLEHGMSFLSNCSVTATDSYADLADSSVVIIAAGASQKPGDTRLDLLKTNIKIIEDIVPRIVTAAPEAVILVVTNPVDILTYRAYLAAGLPKGQVFGSGTTLDTARFRFHLSEFLHINPRSIHAYILGEHGDSSFPVISSATVGGQPLQTMQKFSVKKAQQAFQKAQNAAYTIISTKGATYFAIGTVIQHIVKTTIHNKRSVLPVSVPLHNYQGINGVALSVPCIVGAKGVESMLEIKMSWEEKEQLKRSAKILREALEAV
jgi:L-lactate dehydrogenase